MSHNCAKALQHAHHRKTFRGVAELVEVSDSSNDEEEGKMNVDEAAGVSSG